MMWLNGNGEGSVAANRRTTKPTARFVASNGVVHRGYYDRIQRRPG